MAVQIAVGVVAERLFNEARSLAAEEVGLLLHFKDELEKLAGELEIIQALVADADSKVVQSRTVQLWLKKLKGIAYDAEDVLEEYKYELLRRKVEYMSQTKLDKVRSFFSPLTELAFRIKMGHKIKDINSQLKNVKERGISYGLNPSEFLNKSLEFKMDRIMSSPSIQEATIVGRDKDVIEVVDMLLNAKSEENLAVVGIVGMGGQGKTTLAQLIYKNDQVVNHFQHRIWVCVSDDFKIERLLNEMVQSVIGTNSSLTNREALIKQLQETLKDKRFLLVLDDVWNEDKEKWECMEKDLREISGSIGTKVMVTTRSQKVVSVMHTSQIYHLRRLSDTESWTLFVKRAFAEGGALQTPEFMEIGQRIVTRCGGVPLAIKALGGLLYSKKNIGEWLRIENCDIWSMDDSQGVLPSIKLSYNHLSSLALKQCFAYCSIFPKDSYIYREELIQQWMAQGFLNPPEGSTLEMEELGDAYFNTLLWNSFLQQPDYDEYDKIESCKMHDIVHDFAVAISKDCCFTMKAEQDDRNIEAVHLLLIYDKEKSMDLSQRISLKLRTLYLRSCVIGNEFVDFNEFIKFKYLRTLILKDIHIEQLPTSIGRLKQLRYIDVKYTTINSLPPPCRKLLNLQTLKANLTKSSSIFLGSLINLRHIDFPSRCILGGISRLIQLQTLPYFIVKNKRGCRIEELGPLNKLTGSLIIYGLEEVKNREEAEKANISGKPKVDHLELCWEEEREASDLNDEEVLEGLTPHSHLKSLAIENFKGSRFPSWMTSGLLLQNLRSMLIRGCTQLFELPWLRGFPSLRELYIDDCEKLVALPSMQDLLSLEYLAIEHSGIASIPDMPSSLLSMIITGCQNLFALPSLEGLLSLENLQIVGSGNVPLPNLPPSLRSLTVENCQMLGPLPSSLEELEIRNFLLDSLPDMLPCGLSSLRSLNIQQCKKLVALPRGLEFCTSLERILIEDCPALQGVDGSGLERLPSLEYLSIGGISDGLDYFPWPDNIVDSSVVDAQLYFPSLKELELAGWPKLTSLPDKLQYLPSLEFLTINRFHGLEALPEWLGSIHSLQSLRLWFCDNLKHFPSEEAMQRLTNLQELKIYKE